MATSGEAWGVAAVGNRIYVADAETGLRVFHTLQNVRYVIRVDDGTLGTPYTAEEATDLTEPVEWASLLTTNPAALPFELTDFDVRIGAYPQ